MAISLINGDDEKFDGGIGAYEIDSPSLADYLRHTTSDCLKKILIVDCRCFLDYNDSHIRSAVNAFYSKLMRRRLQENKVCANYLLSHVLGSCRDRSSKGTDDQVDLILYDQSEVPIVSSSLSTKSSSCMFERFKRRCAANGNRPQVHDEGVDGISPTVDGGGLLHDSSKFITLLFEKLRSSSKFKHIMVLRGGFVDFQARFPELCEGAACDESSSTMIGHQSESMCTGGGRQPTSLSSLSQPCLPVGQDGPTRILPFLYLGSQQDALNADTLKKYGIKYVINLSVSCPRPDNFEHDEHFLRIPVNDSYQEKLLPHFERAFEFLDKVRESNASVLIHCLAGISRSPTLAIAYIMKQCNMNSDEAYNYVKQKRPSISPNFNFMGQLLEYERTLKEHQPTASIIADSDHACTPTSSVSTVKQATPIDNSLSPTGKLSIIPSSPSSLVVSTAGPILSTRDDDDRTRRCRSCPVKMQKSASSGHLSNEHWSIDEHSPSTITNINGKREMCISKSNRSQDSGNYSFDHQECVDIRQQLEQPCVITASQQLPWPDRPRGLAGLKARRVLNIPQSVKEDLPSPSTELSKLTFASTLCHSATEPLTVAATACCSTSRPDLAPITIDQHPRIAGVFANNPFFAAFQSAQQQKSNEPSVVVVTDQPRSFVENHMFNDTQQAPSHHQQRSGSFASRVGHFLRRPWTTSNAMDTSGGNKPRIKIIAHSATIGGGGTATGLASIGPPPKSQSAMFYPMSSSDMDSPESGFVESPTTHDQDQPSTSTSGGAYGRDPERESIGSTSSLEIAVK